MAYNIINKNDLGIYHFVCDTVNDLEAIAVNAGQGSRATILSTGAVYNLTSSGWSVAVIGGVVPIRGVDYWTEEDKAEMVAAVLGEIADGVSIDNAAATVVQYQPYEANIRCAEGRTINSVKVTMDGKDITGQVWTGKKTELYHWVQLNLSGCSSSNESLKAINGQSYATYITAENGYTLSGAEIRILMGGNDVSNYYSGDVIAIPNVTGDITITVTALDAAPNYTNLFDKSNAILNQRYDGNGAEVDGAGYAISPTLVSIPTSEDGKGSFTIRIAGLTTDRPSTNLLRMVWRDTSGNIANGGITYVSFTKDSSGVMVGSCVALKPSYGTMCTFSLNLTRGVTAISESDIENIVVTFNEEI